MGGKLQSSIMEGISVTAHWRSHRLWRRAHVRVCRRMMQAALEHIRWLLNMHLTGPGLK